MPNHEAIKLTTDPSEAYEFATFRLDVREQVLERFETGERIPLPAKAFETLCVLLRNSGRLVEKEELLSSVWADSFVEENNLNKSIHAIRRALGDGHGGQKFIETIKKRGFRFVAEVRRVSPPRENGSDRPIAYNSTVREFPYLVTRSKSHGTTAILAAAHPDLESESIFEARKTNHGPMVQELHQPSLLVAPKTVPRRKSSRFLAIAGVTFVLMIAAGTLIYRYASPASTSLPSGNNNVPRLAVLPLKPVNSEDRDRGIELAIADSIILKLSESKAFNVRRLSAVRKYVELDEDPISIGHDLGDDFVLVSNYQIGDGRIRVTARLLNTTSGETVQTFKADAPSEDAFAMQDAVANEIGNAVFAKFGKPASDFASSRGTRSEEAYNLFYEALYLVDKNTKDESAKAADLLGQALSLDPAYAQAWALRAQAYCQFAHNGGGPPEEIFAVAEPMLDRALSIDPRNQIALSVHGIINRDYHWNLKAAGRDLEEAIRIDPGNALPHRYLAGVYYRAGRFAEAVEEQKKAIEIDPTSPTERWLLGHIYFVAGRYDEGAAQLKQVIAMEPSSSAAYDSMWQLYHFAGDTTSAYENFLKLKEATHSEPAAIERYKDAHRNSGWSGVLRTELKTVLSLDPENSYSSRKYHIAAVAALLGEKDIAIKYLEESIRYRLIGISYIKVDPRLNSLRDDPRFKDILRRAKLVS